MIDCHLHLQDPRLAARLPEILETLRSLGIVRLVVNGTHPDDWDRVATLASDCPEVIPSFGLHPWRAGTEPEDWLADLESRLRADPRAGIGEVGLDRWIKGSDFARQQEVFSSQLQLAAEFDRPVTIHCLQAWGTLADILEAAPLPRGFLLHSFGGPVEMVDRFVALGAWFSVSGYFFRPCKETKLAVFDRMPRERILIETDAPDMLPPPEMIRYPVEDSNPLANHPGNLVAVYEALARRFAMPLDDLVHLVGKNFASWISR